MPEIFGEHGNTTPGHESISGGWMPRPEHREGPIARAIEQRTARVPSDAFLWAAVGCMAGSAVMQAIGQKHISLFVGQWVPTILLLGLYNKIVKVAGSH